MDKEYWDAYYKKDLAPKAPSPFAEYVLALLENDKQLLELGCGNGRDSLFFADHQIKVTGLDQSVTAIDNLKEKNHGERCQFLQGDFTQAHQLLQTTFDYVYSRFTFHSINDEQQEAVLKDIPRLLKPGGLFFLEARSTWDPLCGKGIQVGRNAYIYDEHYRRFLDFHEIKKAIEQNGLTIVESIEADNLAVWGKDNPIIIRVIAKK